MQNALENEFGRLITRFIFSMLDVEGFHDDVELATHSSKAKFLERGNQRLEMSKSFPAFAEVLQKVEEISGSQGLDSLIESTTQSSLDGLLIKSDAAIVVFGHSLLDALLFALCKLSHSIEPRDWFPLVSQRQVRVEELLADQPPLIAAKVALAFMESLERESLLRKANLLHAICKPSNTKAIISDFTFSESALKDFDMLRHEIVHGLKFRKPIHKVKSHLTYARQTGIYFLTMLGRKYSLQPRLSEADISSILKPGLS